jgi:predicted transcriptional regulator
MKTAISLPDDLHRRADALARRLGKSRSQVYREAVSEYLARREPQAVTDALDRLADELDLTPDPWLAEAGRQAVERSEW